ncbi:PadR family transcriptional regulator [Streptomyces winkii]|uniref:PadR family transcriptional regulator n=1 Tax=Streptomyces winkii TaxID=3051178 RepID=UPI0028D4F58B|nr:PadR family transcriptional regulator [Streptomyces sp. DSM 40971]
MAADLNPTAAALLGFLHDGEASGYELVRTATELIGDFWTLTRSQVYRELSALADRGLVRAEPVGPRSRQPYRLTDAGRAAFAEWLARPPGGEQIRYPLLLTMAFGSMLERERLLEFVAEHRAVHESRLRRYRETCEADGLDPYEKATLAFGLRYEQAVLDWMDELPSILSGGRGPDG